MTNPNEQKQSIERAVSILRDAKRVVCLTGAGVSVESGLATFRDTKTGQWTRVDPERYATQKGFVSNPADVWQWYMRRYTQMQRAKPNAGHIAIAELQMLFPTCTVVTQNVDDLHERGGSQYVLHLHGVIWRYRCNGCRRPYTLSTEERMTDLPPMCPNCFGFIRPDIIWFEEHLPTGILDLAMTATESCDVMLVIGTSGVVYPAGEFPITAKQHGAALIEVNPEPTPISDMVDVALRGPSGEIMPRLVSAVKQARAQSLAGFQTN